MTTVLKTETLLSKFSEAETERRGQLDICEGSWILCARLAMYGDQPRPEILTGQLMRVPDSMTAEQMQLFDSPGERRIPCKTYLLGSVTILERDAVTVNEAYPNIVLDMADPEKFQVMVPLSADEAQRMKAGEGL